MWYSLGEGGGEWVGGRHLAQAFAVSMPSPVKVIKTGRKEFRYFRALLTTLGKERQEWQVAFVPLIDKILVTVCIFVDETLFLYGRRFCTIFFPFSCGYIQRKSNDLKLRRPILNDCSESHDFKAILSRP